MVHSVRRHRLLATWLGLLWTCIGITVVLILAVAFAKLSGEITENEFALFDRIVALSIHAHASPTQTAVMLVVTELSGKILIGLAILSVPVGAILAWRSQAVERHGWPATLITTVAPALVAGIAALLDTLIKVVVGRTRPDLFPPLTPAAGPSFPSGHALIALSFYGCCAYVIGRQLRGGAQVLVIALGVLIPLGVGYSRIYLGVHHPTDVIGSMILGTAWLMSAIMGLSVAEQSWGTAHSNAVQPTPFARARETEQT